MNEQIKSTLEGLREAMKLCENRLRAKAGNRDDDYEALEAAKDAMHLAESVLEQPKKPMIRFATTRKGF